MDKFKIKILPDSKTIFDIILNIIVMAFVIGTIIYLSGCSDDTFIAGYNKDMEEIHIDSNSVDFERFYIDAQRINNGHE